MDKFVIRLGKAPWDLEYINFNPSEYQYSSIEYTFNVPYIKIAGSKYLFSVDLSKISDINNIIDFNSLYLLGYENNYGRYELKYKAYYLIESIDTVNRGNTIITAVEDSLFNIYMFKGDSKIYTEKLGGSILYDFQSMKDMELPKKDTTIRSENVKLRTKEYDRNSPFTGDFSLPYNHNNSQNSYDQIDTAGKGFASHYSVYQINLTRARLYSNYYPFKDTLKPYWGGFRQGSQDEELFSQKRGKQVVGVQKYYLNNDSLLSFSIINNAEVLDIRNRRQMLNRSFFEISAVIGGNEYDLTDYLEPEDNTSYVDNYWFTERIKSIFKFKITSSITNLTNTATDMSSYKYNLYPSDSIYLHVGYHSNNILTKAYRIPKSQQMYNKYQKYMISNYFQLEQQEKETMINFIANLALLLFNLASPIKVKIDFSDMIQAGANTLEFFGGKYAYEKDISSDFAVLVGGSQQDGNDIRELTELGFHFKLKSYSKEMLEKIYLRNQIEGSVKNTELKIKDAINNNTYIQGILKLDNPTMGDNKVIEVLNRGINSIK